MAMMNLYAGWVGIFLGCFVGAVIGLFFHNENWLGGYPTWRRRMLRLAHISFFGIGFINLSFGLTLRTLSVSDGIAAASWLLIIGAAAMPLVCFLSAAVKSFRHLFVIPAVSVIAGLGLFLWRILIQ